MGLVVGLFLPPVGGVLTLAAFAAFRGVNILATGAVRLGGAFALFPNRGHAAAGIVVARAPLASVPVTCARAGADPVGQARFAASAFERGIIAGRRQGGAESPGREAEMNIPSLPRHARLRTRGIRRAQP